MLAVFLQTLPFFLLIGLGYGSGRSGFFDGAATAALTKFVFYFALSAMLFKFAAGLDLAALFSWEFIWAYLAASLLIYVIATGVGLWRGVGMAESAVEAQCAVIGNVGFLGVPLLSLLLGPEAVGPVMLVLAVDLIVFSSLIVILITASRGGRLRISLIGQLLMGLLKNPMIGAIVLGLAWAAVEIPMPGPLQAALDILGAAATPGALFAIGASLAGKSAERVSVAAWLSFCKLILHPAAVLISALWLFEVQLAEAGVMIAAAALPVAGNVYILAQHYGVAPQRVSSAILLSTLVSIFTITAVVAWIDGGGPEAFRAASPLSLGTE
ncbi:MAG: AEC family transporter [Mangrovicoccus sp.]